MAYTYTWPNTLPQSPQKGFTESIGALVIRTPMDAGPAKERYRGKRSNSMQVLKLLLKAECLPIQLYHLQHCSSLPKVLD